MSISPRILFVLKRRHTPYTPPAPPGTYAESFSSGLYNSVRFISDMLTHAGVENKIIEARDNNDIEPAVDFFKPTHVVVEALWVVPEKFTILTKLFPDVKWIVRLHSDVPFLANEGIAMDWIVRYLKTKNMIVAPNSPFAYRDITKILHSAFPEWSCAEIAERLVYLPNFYPIRLAEERKGLCRDEKFLDIGCFGAIRPLKNNLIQAVAAIHYADSKGLTLRFHTNGGRNEQGGDQNTKNLRALFASTHHELVEHAWLNHEDFLTLLATMDLAMCVSFTETFCIVAADSIAMGVPTVLSKEIKWGSWLGMAETTDADSIVRAIDRGLHPMFGRVGALHSRHRLTRHCESTRRIWLRYFEDGKATHV